MRLLNLWRRIWWAATVATVTIEVKLNQEQGHVTLTPPLPKGMNLRIVVKSPPLTLGFEGTSGTGEIRP
jgi:hypothetical protein